MKKKVALVGCGRISRRHIEAISVNEGLELAVACDIREKRAQKVGEELGIPYLTDLREIRGVDVITIATPSGLRKDSFDRKGQAKLHEDCPPLSPVDGRKHACLSFGTVTRPGAWFKTLLNRSPEL